MGERGIVSPEEASDVPCLVQLLRDRQRYIPADQLPVAR